jgi:hypothetical protein
MTFLGIFGSTFFDTVRSQLSKIDSFGFAVKNAIFDTPIFDTVRNGFTVSKIGVKNGFDSKFLTRSLLTVSKMAFSFLTRSF